MIINDYDFFIIAIVGAHREEKEVLVSA